MCYQATGEFGLDDRRGLDEDMTAKMELTFQLRSEMLQEKSTPSPKKHRAGQPESTWPGGAGPERPREGLGPAGPVRGEKWCAGVDFVLCCSSVDKKVR